MIGQVSNIIYDSVVKRMPSNQCICSSKGCKLYADGEHLTAISRKGVMWKDDGVVKVAVACEDGIAIKFTDNSVCFLTDKFQDNIMNGIYDLDIDLTGVTYFGEPVHKVKMSPDGMANVTTMDGKVHPVATGRNEIPEEFREEIVLRQIPIVEEPSKTEKHLKRMIAKPGLLMFIVFALVLGIGAAVLGSWLLGSIKPHEKVESAEELLERLESDWDFPDQVTTPGSNADLYFGAAPDKYGYSTKQEAPRPKSLTEAKLLNYDATGWIRVPGCSISDPLFSYTGKCTIHGVPDNCFYLCRNIEKARVFSGNPTAVTFVDFRNKLTNEAALSPITVVYGHNWTNTERGKELRVNNIEDKQFAQLPSFASKKFAEERRSFELTTADNMVHRVAVFAVFYTEVNTPGSFYYTNTDASPEQLLSIADRAKKKSEFIYPVTVDKDDKLVVLSTCTMKDAACGQNERFVVMGKIVEADETIPKTPLQVNAEKEAVGAIKAKDLSGTSYGETQVLTKPEEVGEDEGTKTSKADKSSKANEAASGTASESEGTSDGELEGADSESDESEQSSSSGKVVYTKNNTPLASNPDAATHQSSNSEESSSKNTSSMDVTSESGVSGIQIEVSSTPDSSEG